MLNKTTKPPDLNAATPLLAMEVVALDTETTGLEVARDRIVQIGAVRMLGAEIDAGDCLDLLVNPGVAIPPAAKFGTGRRPFSCT